jgi:large subunit ribosomal protein L29
VREMKKAYEFRELSLEDLVSLEREKAEELMHLRMKLKMRQIDNALVVRMARRELARIKTALTEKRAGR